MEEIVIELVGVAEEDSDGYGFKEGIFDGVLPSDPLFVVGCFGALVGIRDEDIIGIKEDVKAEGALVRVVEGAIEYKYSM